MEIKEYIERIERLEQEKKDIQRDIKEVYAEAAAQGIDKKALKQVIKYRKMDPDQRDDFLDRIDNYLNS